MSIYNMRGDERNIVWLPKTASQAFTKNMTVGWTSNLLVPANTGIVGVIKRDVSSADITASNGGTGPFFDYTLASNVPVEIWEPTAIYYADIGNGGTATAANIGTAYDVYSDFLTINLSGTTNKNFIVLGVISATQVFGFLSGSQWNETAST